MRQEGIHTLGYKAALMILALLLVVAGIPGLGVSHGAKAKADDAAEQGWLEVGETGFFGAAQLYVYNGTPYVAYSDLGNGNKATVKRYDGSNWVAVGSAGFTAGAANGMALQVYGGTPYVAFSDGANGNKATVMKYEGNKWVTVGSAGFTAGQAVIFSLIVHNGSPYVAYSSDETDWKAVVVKYDGSDWITLGDAASASSVDTASLFVDNGTPYVAFLDNENNGAAVVRTFDGSGWVTVGSDTNVSDGHTANGTSLYVYKGTPYVAYGDYDDIAEVTKAAVKKYDSASDSWVNVGDVGADSSSASGISLFIYKGTPYVAYTEGGGKRRGGSGVEAVVKKFDGGEWTALNSDGLSAERISSLYVSNGTPYTTQLDSENAVATVMSYGDTLLSPNLIADVAADADLTHDIHLMFTEDAAWRGSIKTVTAGTAKLRAGTDYTVSAGMLTIKAGVLSEGDNEITVKAAGYSNANLVQAVRGFSQAGTQQDPFLIATAGQLYSVRNHLSSGTYFKLMANLDLGLYQTGGGWMPIGDSDLPFEGVFEGDGHTITNLTIYRYSSYVGLFGSISAYGTVSNVNLEHVAISSGKYVGGLAGQNDGTIRGSHAEGSVKGTSDHIGGLAGYNQGTISGSSARGTVTARGGYAGGLAGRNDGTISGSYSTAAVSGTGSTGGLVGMSQGAISGSYATGDVTSSSNGIGGLVGYSQAPISASYATGSVRGEENVGGLVGINESNISDSFSTGSAAGTEYLGGLVGSAVDFQVTRAYAAGRVTGSGSQIGGLLGSKGGGESLASVFYDIEATGQTASAGNYGYGQDQATASMKTMQLYTKNGHAWNFDDVWAIDPSRNNGYPYLRALVNDAAAPTIGTQPNGGNVVQYSSGLTLSTNASVTDGGTVSYQWFSHTSNSNAGGTPIDAATGATYVVPTDTAGTAYYYVAITNTNSRATGSQTATTKSNPVAVTVIVSDSSPTVTADSTEADLSHAIDLTFADDAAWRGAITSIAIETASTMTGTLVAGRDYSVSPGKITLQAGVLSEGGNTIRVKAAGYSNVTLVQPVGGFSQAGTVLDPFQIATAGQLDSIRNHLGPLLYFKLTADIDLSLYAAGNGWMPIGDGFVLFFRGTIDGGGHKISNLMIDRPDMHYIGLIAQISYESAVSNVGMEDVNVTGKNYVGGLAGYNLGAIETSYSKGKVTGTSYVGGMAGSNGGTVSGSYALGEVAGSSENVGGLVGNNHGTIKESFAVSNVTGGKYVGGLAGTALYVNNSFAKGNVTGNSDVGGLVGFIDTAMISNSYAVGHVTGVTDVGGLAGSKTYYPVTINNSFYDMDTTGQSSSAGSNADAQALQNQSSISMKKAKLYLLGGWDFNDIWAIDPMRNNGYPYLSALQIDSAALAIDAQPQAATVLVDATSPVLQVTASVSDEGTLSYQWYKNTTSDTSGGTPIGDATSSGYEAPTAVPGTTYYYAVITSTNRLATGLYQATAKSQGAAVKVNAITHAEIPTILAQPANRTVSQNSPSPSLSVTATVYDGGALSYQWYSNSVDSANGGTAIDGATLAMYEAPATVLGATYYYAVVTNTNNNATGLKTAKATSSVAAVAVNPAPPAPTAPLAPTGLAAVPGNGIVSLTWTGVQGTVTYNVYQGTSAGAYGSSPAATVSEATYYTATGLTNGVTYYFAVTASDAGGTSSFSSDVSATPQVPAPGAPTLQSPIAGNGTVTLNWSPVSGASGYNIYWSAVSGGYGAAAATVSGSVYSYAATGLTNGVPYYFAVKATNDGGDSPASNEVVATPIAPTPPITTPISPQSQPDNKSTEIYVNGKPESAGTATTTRVNDQTVTTVTLNEKKLQERLASENDRAVITVPVNTKSDVVITELNGQIVKSLEDKQAVLEIKTEQATYTLPAQQINIQALSEQLGQGIALQDIKVTIEIAAPPADTLKIVANSAEQGGFSIVVPPLNFTVKGTYGDKTIEIAKFNAYVERTIAIPDGVDPNKITTGVVVEPDGTVRHVPTQVVLIGGKYYAKINSLTNSTYSLVSHTRTFGDVKGHWAERAVNDMGSRMIIDGIGADVFKPDQDITRAEFAAIVVRGLGLKLESGPVPLSDVKASDWSYSAVRAAYEYRLISGFEDGTFRPNDKITREQAMVVIAGAMALTKLNERLPSGTVPDVLRPYADADQASEWAKISIASGLQAGLVSGRSSTELAPKANITRAEVAAIIQRLLQKSGLI